MNNDRIVIPRKKLSWIQRIKIRRAFNAKIKKAVRILHTHPATYESYEYEEQKSPNEIEKSVESPNDWESPAELESPTESPDVNKKVLADSEYEKVLKELLTHLLTYDETDAEQEARLLELFSEDFTDTELDLISDIGSLISLLARIYDVSYEKMIEILYE